MDRKTALIGLTFIDILVIWGFYIGYHQIHQVLTGISNSTDSVSFLNRNGVFFIMIPLPFFHIFSLVDYFKPSLVAKWRDSFHRAILFFTLGLFMLSFFISTGTRQYVEKSGYLYCHDASSFSVLFRTLVYTKDWETCNRLVAEKAKKYKLPPKE